MFDQVFSDSCTLIRVNWDDFERIFAKKLQDMMFIRKVIKNTFKGILSKSMDDICLYCEEIKVKQNENLFKQNDTVDKLYILEKGQIGVKNEKCEDRIGEG